MNKAKFIGTCNDSFDFEGECVIDLLPWRSVEDFHLAEEEADGISREFFNMNVDVPAEISRLTKNHIKAYYLTQDGIWMFYDETADIYYFFTE